MPGKLQLHLLVPLVERQHALIEHLRIGHPKLTTARQLAGLVGVGARTIERDLARLRAAGIPLEVVVGARGGYQIAARNRDCQVVLSPGEVSTLLAALAAACLFSSATAQSAFAKLMDALTPAENSTGTPT